MYKVFVNDKPLFLTNEISKETDFQLFLLESIDIEQLIIKMFQNKIQKASLYYPDEKVILKKLKEKIPVCKAGGGLVFNKKGEVLFILRNGKWDLPKGGIEREEEIADTAIREVEEAFKDRNRSFRLGPFRFHSIPSSISASKISLGGSFLKVGSMILKLEGSWSAEKGVS